MELNDYVVDIYTQQLYIITYKNDERVKLQAMGTLDKGIVKLRERRSCSINKFNRRYKVSIAIKVLYGKN